MIAAFSYHGRLTAAAAAALTLCALPSHAGDPTDLLSDGLGAWMNRDGDAPGKKKALKDFPRSGHIGFQDHGARVAYRNVRITPLGK